MSLWLSPTDLDRHAAAIRALLSPLQPASSPTAWRRSVGDALRALFRAQVTMIIIPEAEGMACYSDDLEPATIRRFTELPAKIAAGAVHLHDREMETVFERLRCEARETWSMEELDARSHRLLGHSAFFNDVVIPNGAKYAVGMRTALPQGEALAWAAHGSAATNPFGTDSSRLMATLVPAFKAGIALLATAERVRDGLASVVDTVPDALLLADGCGRTLYHNRALRELLAEEPGRERLLAAAEERARSVALTRNAAPGAASPRPFTQVGTEAQFRLHAGYFGMGEAAMGGIVVRLERLTSVLPSAPALQERWGLTPREAEVALCLAAGWSNKRVASALGMRPNTVRHHAERIFDKLGLHSRKAMALTLMEGGIASSARPRGPRAPTAAPRPL